MAFEDELEPDWVYEAPFYLVATIAYGILFSMNPTMRWGGGKPPEPTVPIEFVAAPPAPPPVQPANLALPPAGGAGHVEPAPHKGPGEFEAEKVKQGAQDAPPKPAPKPKPAAVKSTRVKHGATINKIKAHPKKKPVVARAVQAAPKPKVIDTKAIMEASIARRAKVEHEKQVKAAAAAAAAAEKARRAEAARLRAEQLAEEKRVKAEAAREKAAELAAEKARKAEEARAAAAARAEAARQRAQAIADAKAAKARKKAELSHELATMNDPDEALAQDEDSAQPSTAHAKIKGKASKAGAAAALAAGSSSDSDGDADATRGAALAGQRKAGAAAALADAAESPDPGDAAGSGGSDVLDAKAKGGGIGPDGNGVSYSVDGPVGNRRLLRRTIPVSPDWVGTRGLDLTVTVRFQVLPNGHVKPGAVVQKTSGFPEIDALALQAIRQWIFESAANANGADVWGRVTFHFTS